MKATGTTAQTLTNIFGGSINNEGLGLFTLSFDWQYVSTLLRHESNWKADGGEMHRSHPSKPRFL